MMAKDMVINAILSYISDYRNDLQIIAEDNYVDKVYRNSFSNYYSTKLNPYPEYCVRLSFLESDVDFDEKDDILKKYLGFMILRPINPGVVGRTAINPKSLKSGDDLMVCRAKIRSSVLGYKTFVEAFPHSSQDSEYSTCAETSIWTLMEYFGNKYPEYTTILPSKIHEILDKKAHERHVPSCGLTYFDISYVLKSCGFGIKNYCRNRYKDDDDLDKHIKVSFRRIFSTYIESGFPVGVAISSESEHPFGHAVVCIGRKKINRTLISSIAAEEINGKKIRRWSDVPSEFVFNDDNVGVYRHTNFNNPAPQYGRNDLYISNIIVPLYNKIYLDAPYALYLSENFCTRVFPISDGYVFRSYLASSNSYMNHIMSDGLLSDIYKNAIINLIRLPKFVWITEIASEEKFIANEVEGLLMLDATEPYKLGVVYPLLGMYDKSIYFYDVNTQSYRVNSMPTPFQITSFSNI
ncbi:MAG: hypothetical protein K2N28_09695, partial [Muribaculaceae bacterium]|nr:hypothetical protein [Muribaculaceae bacterium]